MLELIRGLLETLNKQSTYKGGAFYGTKSVK